MVFPNSHDFDLEAIHDHAEHLFWWLQSILTDERLAFRKFVLVTRGAVGVGNDEDLPGLVQSPLWGLMRTAMLEHPSRSFVIVDIDGQPLTRRDGKPPQGDVAEMLRFR